MPSSTDFRDQVLVLLMPFGPVQARGMFGGYGVFLDEVMFGLIAYDQLYLKIDAENRDDFLAAGSRPFTYEGKKRPIEMSYYLAPGDSLENPETMMIWAESALAAARRSKKAKPSKKKKKK